MCRCLLIVVFFATAFIGSAQSVSVDLSLSNNQVYNAAGGDVDANSLFINQVIRIKVVVGNFVSGIVAPGGHYRVKIGLGNGLILNPGFNLATAPLNTYFNWSYDLSGAQPQIIGTSIAPLPDGFADFADFELKCQNATTSTISFNFLIANPPGTTTPVSDPAPANNVCSNTYSISSAIILPVNFTSLNAIKNNCEVNVLWDAENQLNLSKYEIEFSKDNRLFTKLGEVTVKNDPVYRYTFALTDQLRSSTIFVRIKSIDVDGSFQYSKTIPLSGNCGNRWQLALFPNPVSNESAITVMAKEGIFDGRYKVSIISSNGQLVQQQEMKFKNMRSFSLSATGLSNGKYHVRIVGLDDQIETVLDFEKL